MESSKILKDSEHIRQLKLCIEQVGYDYEWRLLYRATEHNFSSRMFHKCCDRVKGTLTISKNEHGKILGGYNPYVWDSRKKNLSKGPGLGYFIFGIGTSQYNTKKEVVQFFHHNGKGNGFFYRCDGSTVCFVHEIGFSAFYIPDGKNMTDKYSGGVYLQSGVEGLSYSPCSSTRKLTGGGPKFLFSDYEVYGFKRKKK